MCHHHRRHRRPGSRAALAAAVVLTLYYYEGLTLGEIGGILGITESRVCQIHTKAVILLRSKLSEPQREPA